MRSAGGSVRTRNRIGVNFNGEVHALQTKAGSRRPDSAERRLRVLVPARCWGSPRVQRDGRGNSPLSINCKALAIARSPCPSLPTFPSVRQDIGCSSVASPDHRAFSSFLERSPILQISTKIGYKPICLTTKRLTAEDLKKPACRELNGKRQCRAQSPERGLDYHQDLICPRSERR